MKIEVVVGDVLRVSADALISTANPWLNMSGGVNGAIAAEFPELQLELKEYLRNANLNAVSAGTVVATSAGGLPFGHIFHAVAIDPFYDSSIQLVRETLGKVFEVAHSRQVRSISLPTLATGYGPLTVAQFAAAFSEAVVGVKPFDCISIVVRTQENAEIVSKGITKNKP